jgi:outer membrane protein TolC
MRPSPPSSPPLRWPNRRHAVMAVQLILLFCLLSGFALSAFAQISISTAVDLALRSNPRILSAQDDVRKAHAQLSEVYDAYVPTITAGGGIGQAYGYSSNPPTLGTVSGGSLVFNASQSDYTRSARSGLKAANFALDDMQEAVAQDTALAFVTLDHDQQRAQAIRQQSGFAISLSTIVQQRLDAGQDTQIDLTEIKLTAAQLRLAGMKADDDVAYDREHLGHLIGLPAASISIDDNFPSVPIPGEASDAASTGGYANAAVASAFASAEAQRQKAAGEARFRFWPEINLVAQYNRYATFTESFAQLKQVYTVTNKAGVAQTLLTANEGAFGIQISLPILDKGRSAKARQSAADASKSLHDAQSAQIDALDGASRLRHSIAELEAQTDIATLQQQLAQQQLDIVRVQLNTGNGVPFGPQMSPKDEQKARIAERDKYLLVIDANFQVREAEIQLLRQTGGLQAWLKSSTTAPSAAPGNIAPAPAPHP